MKSIKPKRIGLALLMFVMMCSISQAANYFRVIDGIPHLPVFTDTNSVPSPSAGALVYVSTLYKPMVYSGTGWESICTSTVPLANDGYFKIAGGIPILPVSASAAAGAASGSVYYSSGGKITVSNGATWEEINSVSGLSVNPGFSTDPDLDIVQIPVLATNPAGVQQGAVYFNSGDDLLHYYTGSQWVPQRCGPPFITKWDMTADDFILQVGVGTYNCTIDWGDGSEPNIYVETNPGNFTHDYNSDINDCNITISGTFPHLRLYLTAGGDKLTKVVQWGDVGFTSFETAFDGCAKLVELPTDPIPGGAATKFGYMFRNCDSLINVPGGLFSQCPNASIFSNVFLNCDNLATIGSGLFANCSAATSFVNAFSQCKNLEGIPADTFAGCNQAKSFGEAFYSCSDINSIPADLFADCTSATTFTNTFKKCSSLATISAADPNRGLFEGLSAVTDFSRVFEDCGLLTSIPVDTFKDCNNVMSFMASLSGCGSLTSIPENLFATNDAVTNFSYTFRNTDINSIPEGLFADCNQVTTFASCFTGDSGLTGESPLLWDTHPTATGTSCFTGCVNAANWHSIPEDWGGPFVPGSQFITKWDMTSGAFTMPVQSGTIDCTVDWGDGNVIRYTSAPSHDYASDINDCNVTIIGTFPGLKINTGAVKDKITEVVQWGDVGFTSFALAFYNCDNLVSLPNEPIPYNTATNFSNMFNDCDGLDSNDINVPGGLFSNCTSAANMQHLLKATGITSIPAGLFGNIEATNMDGAFMNCPNLGLAGANSVPAGLFANCKKVDAFSKVFSGCANLTTIPADLFDTSEAAGTTTFSSAFNGCTSLTSIPGTLFQNCTNAEIFSSVFQSTGINSIPAGLFDDCTEVTSFASAFQSCSDLGLAGANSVPDGLFANCKKVTSFVQAFFQCVNLDTIPADLFDTSEAADTTSFLNTFWGCSELDAIPAGLFDNCTNSKTFEQVFEGCDDINSIPEGLFAGCNQATSFREAFYHCDDLTTIGPNTFAGCTSASLFNGTFQSCTSLTAIPPGLFANCTNATNFVSVFQSTGIDSIPPGLFDDCNEVTDFGRAFYTCSGLGLAGANSVPAGLFANCKKVTNFNEPFYMCGELTTVPSDLFDTSEAAGTTSFLNAFYACSKLKEIPAGLFDNCTNAGTFEQVFEQCDDINSIPEGLFADCDQATNFRDAFYGCDDLTTIGPNTFAGCTSASLFNGTFQSCTSLTAIPPGLFDDCQSVTTFNSCFNGCTTLDGLAPELWTWPGPPTGVDCFNNCTELDNWADIVAAGWD